MGIAIFKCGWLFVLQHLLTYAETWIKLQVCYTVKSVQCSSLEKQRVDIFGSFFSHDTWHVQKKRIKYCNYWHKKIIIRIFSFFVLKIGIVRNRITGHFSVDKIYAHLRVTQEGENVLRFYLFVSNLDYEKSTCFLFIWFVCSLTVLRRNKAIWYFIKDSICHLISIPDEVPQKNSRGICESNE